MVLLLLYFNLGYTEIGKSFRFSQNCDQYQKRGLVFFLSQKIVAILIQLVHAH